MTSRKRLDRDAYIFTTHDGLAHYVTDVVKIPSLMALFSRLEKKRKKKKLRVFVLGFLLIPFLLIGSVMLLPFWSPFQANENLLY